MSYPDIGFYRPYEKFEKGRWIFRTDIFLPAVRRIVDNMIPNIEIAGMLKTEQGIDIQIQDIIGEAKEMCKRCPIALQRKTIDTPNGPITGECSSLLFAMPMGIQSNFNMANLSMSRPIEFAVNVCKSENTDFETPCGIPFQTHFPEITSQASEGILVFNLV